MRNIPFGNNKVMMTPEGGIAIRMTNKTGSNTVKGYLVSAHATVNNAFKLAEINVPSPLGIVYEDGIADGQECWIVVAGIADVYYIGNVALGTVSRGFITGESDYVIGKAKADTIPNPLSDDKHFYEIGHPIAARTGAGLCKTIVHFN